MAVNKVIVADTPLIDLTNTTATADKIISGYTAYGKDGELMIGVAAGIPTTVQNLDELKNNWNNEGGFIMSYNNATTGLQYITNTVNTSKGIFVEKSDVSVASTWYLEQISGYTDRFYIFTFVDKIKKYMFNNVSAGANFMGLSETDKTIFIISYADESKFYFKISTGNKWLQHSNSGGGIRLWTDNNTAANSQLSLTYNINSIVPYGTLAITENGTYDATIYKTVIVNV